MSKPLFKDVFSFQTRRNRLSFSVLHSLIGCLYLFIYLILANSFTIHPVLALVSFYIFSTILLAQRLRDINISGWFALVFLLPFMSLLTTILMIIPGTDGKNKFGSNPINEGTQNTERNQKIILLLLIFFILAFGSYLLNLNFSTNMIKNK